MFKYILKRLMLAILTMLIIIVVVYTVTALFQKDPFVSLEDAGNNANIKEENLKLANAYFLKDKSGAWVPVLDRLALYLFGNKFFGMPIYFRASTQELFQTISVTGMPQTETIYGIFEGNPGPIFLPENAPGINIAEISVDQQIPLLFFRPLKYTIGVTLPSFIISAILGVTLGVVAGYKRGKFLDTFINSASLLFVAIPSFVLAPLIIKWGLALGFPPSYLPIGEYTLAEVIKSYIPIIFIISISSLSGYIIYTRNQVVTVLNSNYVLIAKSKGLNQSQIFFKYVLRNISIPLVAIIIPSYIILLSGSIVIERYWNIPGTSTIIVNSFQKGETNIIMFNVIFFSLLSVFTAIIVDVAVAIMDPRIKYSSDTPNSLIKRFHAWKIRKQKIKEFKMNSLQQKGEIDV
ncbi:ABC transporter permease [Mycoplasma phocimorsus]|uniref:ABC transporter permease n=1 Tax=Mycoplasma phocimorsus TaxID=3045839 RepID=UPI0024C0993E|nr:ABC transporter permease [Mycoplasma phocimorsus]MDJ1646933.1 ABC transporter permease [Mycoplasma phocimorsus]MDJ1648768.1 ABC transporter permease [Mycoplasma phocimorsus]